MSKQPLYAKLQGDEFAEGKIYFDLSRKVTCITGEIDLMKLLRHISLAIRTYPVTSFANRKDGIAELCFKVYGKGTENRASLLKAVFEFASTVMERQIELKPTISSVDMLEHIGQDAQYLINWVSAIVASFFYKADTTLENCSQLFIVPYPETFLSPKQQSRLMPALLQLLPNAKFVIATQSPVILTTISNNPKDYYIYKMETLKGNRGDKLKMNALQYQRGMYGAEMNEAYYTFYDMERVVPEVDQLLKLLQEQTKAKSFDEADITVKQLESMIGHSDRELMRLIGILDTRKMLNEK